MSRQIDKLPELLTIGEMAEYLQVSTATLRYWGKVGKINELRTGKAGHRRYTKKELLRLVSEAVKRELEMEWYWE